MSLSLRLYPSFSDVSLPLALCCGCLFQKKAGEAGRGGWWRVGGEGSWRGDAPIPPLSSAHNSTRHSKTSTPPLRQLSSLPFLFPPSLPLSVSCSGVRPLISSAPSCLSFNTLGGSKRLYRSVWYRAGRGEGGGGEWAEPRCSPVLKAASQPVTLSSSFQRLCSQAMVLPPRPQAQRICNA